MQEFLEIAKWRERTGAGHEIQIVDTLPAPEFMINGEIYVSFSSNNYLGLSSSKRLIESAKRGLEKYGVANCESRILGGDLQIYIDLEAKLAKMKKKQSSMLFATGYLTNLGVLSALVRTPQLSRAYGYRPSRQFKYVYFTDQFNHISIREGIMMSGADRVAYRHCDLNHLESKLKDYPEHCKIIVTDGVFSMDGDIAPLPGLIELCERYDATLYVDDAHGTGVLGTNGGGISEYFNVYHPRMIHMGTLSKAYGAIGGFIATEKYLSDILRLSASAYGFTSTLPPDQAYAVSEAIDMVIDEPERRQRLWDNQRYFIDSMKKLGHKVMSEESAIVPVFIGNEKITEAYTHELIKEKIHVDDIKFPAVGLGQGRLRFNMHANHTRTQIDKVVGVMESLSKMETFKAVVNAG